MSFPSQRRSQLGFAATIAALIGTAVFSVGQSSAPKSAPPLNTPASGVPAGALGSVTFPNSGAPVAQAHFLRGVAALHSFWYEEAREAFQDAAKDDPSFALAYWGEALTWNHSLWQFQDRDQANAALAKIPANAKLTPRERGFVAAARILFGEGDKLTRDIAFAAALEKLHNEFPTDDEVTAFYALSILGTMRASDYGKGYTRQAKAGALVLDLYARNPNHPGAAHYIIHSFDDPEHAILALPAARRYAEIAPEAHHAQHMPSHIFLQLGLWDSAAKSNESSWSASVNWVERKQLTPSLRDFHSYHWLTYIYLQQGRQQEALKLVDGLRAFYKQTGPAGVRWNDDILAAYVIETQQWDQAETILQKPASLKTAGAYGTQGVELCGTAATTPARGERRGLEAILFTRALAAAQRNAPEAAALLAEVAAAKPKDDEFKARLWEIGHLEITGALAAAQGRFDDAVKALTQATRLEEQTAKPSGPPTLLKPSHELLGEVLLRAGRPAEAAKQFELALSRQAGRALSQLGLAQARAAVGDKAGATTSYNTLLEAWKLADADLPALREAREYVKAAGTPGLAAR